MNVDNFFTSVLSAGWFSTKCIRVCNVQTIGIWSSTFVQPLVDFFLLPDGCARTSTSHYENRPSYSIIILIIIIVIIMIIIRSENSPDNFSCRIIELEQRLTSPDNPGQVSTSSSSSVAGSRLMSSFHTLSFRGGS